MGLVILFPIFFFKYAHNTYIFVDGDFQEFLFFLKKFLIIEDKSHRTSPRVYKPTIDPFAKKWSSKNIKHLTSWSLQTSYELYSHGGLPQLVLQFQSSFPHSTTFLADLLLLDYRKHARDATCNDYFLISDALKYILKYWEWI